MTSTVITVGDFVFDATVKCTQATEYGGSLENLVTERRAK